MSRQITWGDTRESYNKVTGKQTGIGQEARAGTREKKWMHVPYS